MNRRFGGLGDDSVSALTELVSGDVVSPKWRGRFLVVTLAKSRTVWEVGVERLPVGGVPRLETPMAMLLGGASGLALDSSVFGWRDLATQIWRRAPVLEASQTPSRTSRTPEVPCALGVLDCSRTGDRGRMGVLCESTTTISVSGCRIAPPD